MRGNHHTGNAPMGGHRCKEGVKVKHRDLPPDFCAQKSCRNLRTNSAYPCPRTRLTAANTRSAVAGASSAG